MKSYPSWDVETSFFEKPIIGVDEVGRGSVAGPLVVCAVRFFDFPPVCWRDSKQMTPSQRKMAVPVILDHSYVGLGIVSPWDIDQHGIKWALEKAAKEAIAQIPNDADALVVFDGPKALTNGEFQYECLIKGDSLLPSVAAASVVAKVVRDELMVNLDMFLPQYGFHRNKGYGTSEHLEAIENFGVTAHHRRSFLRRILGQEQTLF